MTDRAPAQHSTARLLSNTHMVEEIYRAVLALPAGWGPPSPGQFVQIECPPREAFGMWRPFSISRYRVGAAGPELELVYGAVGTRTRNLARMHGGATLDLIGPLGRGFSALPDRRPVLLGGGRGVAPMIGLAEAWHDRHPDGLLLYGARSASLLIPVDESPYALRLATEDGSAGFRGHLVALLDDAVARGELDPKGIALYACGPNRMLAALSSWAEARGVPCQVSLETHFGCGVGICAGCAVPPKPREGEDASRAPSLACVEGPVMDGTRVEWEGVAE
ncbi:MAG: dihydroorotate dehydrogenase electron transfer subunit [Candidatus Eisenbacteria bacterium]